MDYDQFRQDLMELVAKYSETAHIMCFVYGVAYLTPEEVDGMYVGVNTLLPVPPKDHEEALLRDVCCKDISNIVNRLVSNTYLGRMDDEEGNRSDDL